MIEIGNKNLTPSLPLKGSLLIVDDEILITSKIEMFLSDVVEKTYTAFNGLEALPILRSERITCIVCDLNMPKMDGLELLKTARQEGIYIPFIFYTAYGEEDIIADSKKFGVFALINKPFIDGLEETVIQGLLLGNLLTEKKDQQVGIQATIKELENLINEREGFQEKRALLSSKFSLFFKSYQNYLVEVLQTEKSS